MNSIQHATLWAITYLRHNDPQSALTQLQSLTKYITHVRSLVKHSLRRVRNTLRDLENQRTSVQNQLIDLQLETSSTDDAEMQSFCKQCEPPVSK